MAQRVLAVLGAIGLVLAAIAVRNVIDDDGADDPSDDGDGEVVLVCATDLATMCDALSGVRVVEQDAADTAAAIEAGDDALDGVDGWVTSSAWVEVVDSRAPEFLGEVESLASSPVIVAADSNRGAAVEALCAGEPLWRCLGTNAGAEWGTLGSGGDSGWGPLKTGLPSGDTAVGLSVLASAASGFFDGVEFARNDFDSQDLRGWLTRLAAPSEGGERTPVRTLVTARGKYTSVGDVRAAVGSAQVTVLETSPLVTATVVVARVRGGDRVEGLGRARDALMDAGWTASSGEAPAPILKPGVMAALHTLWTEVR